MYVFIGCSQDINAWWQASRIYFNFLRIHFYWHMQLLTNDIEHLNAFDVAVAFCIQIQTVKCRVGVQGNVKFALMFIR